MNPHMTTRDDDHLDFNRVQPITSTSFLRRQLAWGQDSVAAENFHLLAHRLHRARTRKSFQTVLITSAIPGEGKSTVALNLSGTLAQNGPRTLLIDADLRLPDARKAFAFDSGFGLGAVLAGEVSLNDALRFVAPLGVYVLPAGERVANPTPVLEGPAFKTLLKRARENFDWVIIDSPPLRPFADAHCIAFMAEAILLVVKWGFTPKRQLDHALKALDGLPLLGMVLNSFDDTSEKYYNSYYHESAALPAPVAPRALPSA